MNKDFSNLQNQLLEKFPDLEEKRAKAVKNLDTILLMFFIGLFILAPLAVLYTSAKVVLACYFIILVVFAHKKEAKANDFKRYFNLVKTEYINIVLKEIDDSFKFHGGLIPFSDIKKTNLIKPQKVDVYGLRGEDYFSGYYNGVKVQVSELGFGVHGRLRATLMITNFNKTLQSETYVIDRSFFKQSKKSKDTHNFSSILKPKGHKIVLENLDFERSFEVTSDDEIEARYILSFSFMERLLKIKRIFNKQRGPKLFISFKEDKVSFLFLHKALFEPSLKKPVESDESFSRFYEELTALLNVIDILRLNEKIWKS